MCIGIYHIIAAEFSATTNQAWSLHSHTGTRMLRRRCRAFASERQRCHGRQLSGHRDSGSYRHVLLHQLRLHVQRRHTYVTRQIDSNCVPVSLYLL